MMKCPRDNTDLVRTTREGVEIDYCPTCRGVWLDRGELDKIIAQSTALLPEDAFESPTVAGMHGKVTRLESDEAQQDDSAGKNDHPEDVGAASGESQDKASTKDEPRRSPREPWQTEPVAGMSGKVQPLQSQQLFQDEEAEEQTDEKARSNRKTTRRSFLEELFDFG